MRTRWYDALTNEEVTSYLRHNDLIFLPVGTAEMHGEMPLGCEYVLPLAWALRLAEEAEGLVLPHLAYFYPGATAIGRGTIAVSPSAGAAYLKEISHSLCRQGFRRQVFLSAHGPAHVTLSQVVREVFEETRCMALYLDLVPHLAEGDFNKLIWGAYSLLGYLEDVPTDQKPVTRAPRPEAPLTPEQRQQRAQEGLEQLNAVVAALDAKTLVEGMRDLDKFVQHHVLPKHEERLP